MERIEIKRIKAYVADMLREGILSGKLTEGAELRQESVAEQLGVSRTPVREAFQQLEESGFLLRLPNRHTVVAGTSARQARQTLRLAEAMERELIHMLLEGGAGFSDIAGPLEAVAGEPRSELAERELSFHEGLAALLRNRHAEIAMRRLLREHLLPALMYAEADFDANRERLLTLVRALNAGDGPSCADALSAYYAGLSAGG